MANTPNQNNILEFHIKHTPGGAFTDAIFGDGANSINMIKEKDILRLEGPLGTFFLRNSKRPIIFLASGTGFAPIKAISESIFSKGIDRKIVLFWGVRKPEDLYMNEKIIGWSKQFSNFEFIPVISEDVPENLWSGKRGFVHHVAMSMYPDMRNYSVYSCGAPIVVRSAQEDFISQCNLPENEFFSDAFTTAADNLENKK